MWWKESPINTDYEYPYEQAATAQLQFQKLIYKL